MTATLGDTNNEQEKDFWNYFQKASRDESFTKAQSRLNHIIKVLKKKKKEGKVLDIGLGNGYLLGLLHTNSFETYGLDISDANVAKLRERMPDSVSLHVGNINALPFEDNAFDAITASELIEHLNNDDLEKGIAEIYRCLKPGGMAIITTPDKEKLEDLICYCPKCGFEFHRIGHKQSFSPERLQQLFSKQQFSSVEVRKFLEIDNTAKLFDRIKYPIKMKVVNLPIKRFQSYLGRLMVIVEK